MSIFIAGSQIFYNIMFLFNIGSQLILDKENIPIQKSRGTDMKMKNKQKSQQNLIQKVNIINSSINSSNNSFLEQILTNQIIAEGISEYLQSDTQIKDNLAKSKQINLLREKLNKTEQMIIKIKNEKKADIIQESFLIKETKLQNRQFSKHSPKTISNKQTQLIDSFVIQIDQDQNLDESHFIEAQIEKLSFGNVKKEGLVEQNKTSNDEILLRVSRLQLIYEKLIEKLKKVENDRRLSTAELKSIKKLKSHKKIIYLNQYNIKNSKKHKTQSISLSKLKNILPNKSTRIKSNSNRKSIQHRYFKSNCKLKMESDSKLSKYNESEIKCCKNSSEHLKNKYKGHKIQNILKKEPRYLKL